MGALVESFRSHRNFYIFLISVLSLVPPKKKPELYDQALAVSENQIEVFWSGIIDKTMKDEAVDNFGMKYANG
jgi:hypothetical protein